jgi:ketosteroid isomerase-like protein
MSSEPAPARKLLTALSAARVPLSTKGENLNEETNTQLIQQAYQSVKTGDIPSFLNILAENVLWILPDMANVPFAGTWQGREQVGQFFRRMVEVQDIVEFEPEEFIAKGEKVVVLGHFTMRVKATGKPSCSQWVHVWKVDEGKISYMREYVDTLAVSRAYSPADHLD